MAVHTLDEEEDFSSFRLSTLPARWGLPTYHCIVPPALVYLTHQTLVVCAQLLLARQAVRSLA